jgi:2-polyprenyl-3-methyl-5-hydroxy-6-metoxy-1,4-benzoquinol methylase
MGGQPLGTGNGKSDRFAFGRNWQRYLDRHLTPAAVAWAEGQTASFLKMPSLQGKTFLDIGCGSGLFSYAAYRLGAKAIVSFDYDADAVAATKRLHERAGSPVHWRIMRGSILDTAFVEALPKSDIVYSWGVLHHTGEMWKAMRNAAGLVPPGGSFFIAIYNKQEYRSFGSLRGSHFWLRLKTAYNRGGWPTRLVLEASYRGAEIAKMLVRLRNPFKEIEAYSASSRGMSWNVDITDWLGGLPYEFASVDEVFRFCHDECGLELRNLRSTVSWGCNQFLFERPNGLRDGRVSAHADAALRDVGSAAGGRVAYASSPTART